MKAFILIFLTSLLLVWFQNCEEGQNELQGTDPKGVSKVVSIESDSYLQVSLKNSQELNQASIDVDLITARLTITDLDGKKSTCDLPDEVVSEFSDLLTDVEICEPAPLGPDEFACLAIGIPDIQLTSDTNETVWLQPLVCNTGSFLCDSEKNEQLRALLADITCDSL